MNHTGRPVFLHSNFIYCVKYQINYFEEKKDPTDDTSIDVYSQ